MKSIMCKLGIHDWDGCTCRRCGKQRDKGHVLDRDNIKEGRISGCKCKKCGKTMHNFEVIDEHDEYPTCPNSGTECWGPCGLCDPPGTAYHVMLMKCKDCGYETTESINLWVKD